MKFTTRISYVDVIGQIWMPAVTAVMRYNVSSYDLENMRDDNGNITRDSVENWLGCHAGDFQSVTDFSASLEDGDETVDLPWADEESELTYGDCMFPEED
jgi:hypothetical protein